MLGALTASELNVAPTCLSSLLQFMMPNLENLPEQARQAIGRLQKLESGEPWLFGIPKGEEEEFLDKCGLKMRELLQVGGARGAKASPHRGRRGATPFELIYG